MPFQVTLLLLFVKYRYHPKGEQLQMNVVKNNLYTICILYSQKMFLVFKHDFLICDTDKITSKLISIFILNMECCFMPWSQLNQSFYILYQGFIVKENCMNVYAQAKLRTTRKISIYKDQCCCGFLIVIAPFEAGIAFNCITSQLGGNINNLAFLGHLASAFCGVQVSPKR